MGGDSSTCVELYTQEINCQEDILVINHISGIPQAFMRADQVVIDILPSLQDPEGWTSLEKVSVLRTWRPLNKRLVR